MNQTEMKREEMEENTKFVKKVLEEKIDQILKTRQWTEGDYFTEYDLVPYAGHILVGKILESCRELVKGGFLESKPIKREELNVEFNVYRVKNMPKY